jgi:hypothetical protein
MHMRSHPSTPSYPASSYGQHRVMAELMAGPAHHSFACVMFDTLGCLVSLSG